MSTSSSYRPSSLFTSSSRLPPAGATQGGKEDSSSSASLSLLANRAKNSELANFLSTSANTGGVASSTLTSRFGALDDARSSNYYGGGGTTTSSTLAGRSSGYGTLTSSPPKTTSALSHQGLFYQLGGGAGSQHNNNNNNSDGKDSHIDHGADQQLEQQQHHISGFARGGLGGGTLIDRIERLEAFKHSLPTQLEAMDERVRTIAEERSQTQLSGLILEMSALSQQVHVAEASSAAVRQEMENQLRAFRAEADDARSGLENEVRELRQTVAALSSSVSSSQQLKSAQELSEAIVERRMAMQRDEIREMIRHETKKVRDEMLDALVQMRVEIEDAKRVVAIRQGALADSVNNNNSSSSNNHNLNTSGHSARHQEEQTHDLSSSPASLSVLRSQQLHHRTQDQLVESKLRTLEMQLSSQLTESTRSLESKLLCRVREMSENSRADLSEHVNSDIDSVKQTLMEDLTHSLDNMVRRETAKLKKSLEASAASAAAAAAASSSGHSRSNSNPHAGHMQQQQLFSASAVSSSSSLAAETILDGVDLFLRELQLHNHPLYAQCVELILDVRQRGGPTSVNDALLLMWKFLRGFIANSGVLTEAVGTAVAMQGAMELRLLELENVVFQE